LNDTSQQVDFGIVWDKIYLQIAVIVLLDYMDRDKQLNTYDSRQFPEAINLSHVILKIRKQIINVNCTILSYI